MRLIIILSILYGIFAYKYGNIYDVSNLENYDDAIYAMEEIEQDYNKFNKLSTDLKKFINFNDFKCFTGIKTKCLINDDVYEQIDFINGTITNNTILEPRDKKRFSAYVGNLKAINYLHFTYSKELRKPEGDQYFDEYLMFPVELYSYVGYFRYKQSDDSVLKILNYLDNTRHHAKNVIDHINSLKEQIEEFNPDIKKNYVKNYRILRKRKQALWWEGVYNYWFDY